MVEKGRGQLAQAARRGSARGMLQQPARIDREATSRRCSFPHSLRSSRRTRGRGVIQFVVAVTSASPTRKRIDPSPATADGDTQTAQERKYLAKKGEKSLTYLENKI